MLSNYKLTLMVVALFAFLPVEGSSADAPEWPPLDSMVRGAKFVYSLTQWSPDADKPKKKTDIRNARGPSLVIVHDVAMAVGLLHKAFTRLEEQGDYRSNSTSVVAKHAIAALERIEVAFLNLPLVGEADLHVGLSQTKSFGRVALSLLKIAEYGRANLFLYREVCFEGTIGKWLFRGEVKEQFCESRRSLNKYLLSELNLLMRGFHEGTYSSQ